MVTPAGIGTRHVVVYYEDGSSVESLVTPRVERMLQRLEERELRNTAKFRRSKKALLDKLKQTHWRNETRHVQRHGPEPGVLYLGDSAVWAGPASLWLGDDGKPCRPGEEPVPMKNGRVRPRSGHHARCRFCSHLDVLPPRAVCLNDGCLRRPVD
jgi:hypothetical protein